MDKVWRIPISENNHQNLYLDEMILELHKKEIYIYLDLSTIFIKKNNKKNKFLTFAVI